MGKKTSYERLTPYLRGAVFAFAIAGFTLDQIRDHVRKPDGTKPCLQTVSATISRCRAEGGLRWDGCPTSTSAVGKPRVTTSALDKKIQKLVFKHRGQAKVTAAWVRKKLKETRRLSTRTLTRRLEEAGLAWLRRRRKSIVTVEHKIARTSFAKWALRRTMSTLTRWAFTDGTAFYLARTVAEQQQSVRASLGPMVWRMADGTDALYEDCIGPSSYKKSQGNCVRIWGLLLAGSLFVYVLPEGRYMDRWRYEWVVLHMFPKWIKKALGPRRVPTFLVQDHEKCLWTKEPRTAMKKIGLKLMEHYPKCSQDLNAIETAWRELRARLYDTEPTEMESRPDFIVRLRSAVAWTNKRRAKLFKKLCSDQKERAKEVLVMKGGRTSF